jgi:uncharacterized membrane protein YkvA (DUF1232 family)
MTKKQKDEVKRLADDIDADDEAEVRAGFKWAEAAARARGAARDLLESVRLLWQMLTDPHYVMRWETKAWVIAGLAYFISPLDAIPDPIPGAGYLDDAVVIAWCLHQISEEVQKYRRRSAQTQ